MDMGVDHPGKHGRRPQVEHPCAGRHLNSSANIRDAIANDENDLIVLGGSRSRVEEPPGADRRLHVNRCPPGWFVFRRCPDPTVALAGDALFFFWTPARGN
jgi:hypothetical protein